MSRRGELPTQAVVAGHRLGDDDVRLSDPRPPSPEARLSTPSAPAARARARRSGRARVDVDAVQVVLEDQLGDSRPQGVEVGKSSEASGRLPRSRGPSRPPMPPRRCVPAGRSVEQEVARPAGRVEDYAGRAGPSSAGGR